MAGLLDTDPVDVEFMEMDKEFPVDPDPSFLVFPCLPCELRLDIIEEWLRSRGDTYWTPGDLTIVRADGTYRQRSRPCNPLAEYATINKQWRSVVEKHTFRSLTFAIPEFGRSTLLDDGGNSYRSSAHQALDKPDTLDEFERICIGKRINAVLKIQISINLHNDMGRPRTMSSLDTVFSTGGHGDNTDQSILQIDQSIDQIKHKARAAFEKVLQTLARFQKSRLKSLHLDSKFDGLRMADLMLPTHPSLNLSQCLYAMTCRLEELTLWHVVNVAYFLRESWNPERNTHAPHRPPAWPKMRVLRLRDYFVSLEASGCTREAAELHSSVTQALPQIPNLTELIVSLEVPEFIDFERRCHLQDSRVCIRIFPRDDHSAIRDGLLAVQGPEPDPKTLSHWFRIARRQWDCNFGERREDRGACVTYWEGS